ncbi:MAG: chemotaxis protein CheC [Candidatus Heimdallarchaeota archaeon]
MNQIDELKEFHLDALRELSNVGAGHSATALAQLLNRRVDMSVPYLHLVRVEEAVSCIDRDRGLTPTSLVSAVVSRTEGDVVFTAVVLLDGKSVNNILRIMKTGHTRDIELTDLTAMDKSIVREIGNILLLHYISSVNTFLSLNAFPASPHITTDMLQAVLDDLMTGSNTDASHVLLVNVDIFTDPATLSAAVLLLPDAKAMDQLMTKLFGEGWQDF